VSDRIDLSGIVPPGGLGEHVRAVANGAGARLADTRWGDLPEDFDTPGAYWKYLDRKTGEPMDCGDEAAAKGNLTRTVWGINVPGNGVGTLRLHTVREHDDGTISVRPGDGSSNSILQGTWHGYIEHGVWTEC
jgi:hypothetical protein